MFDNKKIPFLSEILKYYLKQLLIKQQSVLLEFVMKNIIRR